MSVEQSSEAGDIEAAEAERLVAQGAVRVLDVRTPEEFTALGHIPGAILLPVDLAPSAPATLPRDGTPILVCCEHGVRSAFAARLLARAGFKAVLNLRGGMSCWRGPRDHAPASPYAAGPSSWLVANADLLPRGGRVIDLACGPGRHSLLLAAAGFSVRAVDRDAEKIGALRDVAARLQLSIDAEVLDLEQSGVDLGEGVCDVLLGIHYLHRPLFPALARALRPGGLLLYETFTVDQAARGRPTRPEFLLQRGELPRLIAPLQPLRQREGEFDDRMVASIAARKPPQQDATAVDGAAGRN
jgi:tellurite methyltransferase